MGSIKVRMGWMGKEERCRREDSALRYRVASRICQWWTFTAVLFKHKGELLMYWNTFIRALAPLSSDFICYKLINCLIRLLTVGIKVFLSTLHLLLFVHLRDTFPLSKIENLFFISILLFHDCYDIVFLITIKLYGRLINGNKEILPSCLPVTNYTHPNYCLSIHLRNRNYKMCF